MAKQSLFYGTYFDADKLELASVVWRFDRGVEHNPMLGEPCFVSTVNLRTGAEDMECSGECTPEMHTWLALNFNAEYVKRDGLAMLKEYMQGASDILAVHEEFGQNTFHADLEELYGPNDEYMAVDELMARQ